MAVDRICASKKGISAHQLHREIGVTYKSAWFMAHRIRHALTPEAITKLIGIIEVDETYVGPKNVPGKAGRGALRKTKVVSLIERGGRARSFRVPDVKGETLKALIMKNVGGNAHIMTDEFKSYRGLAKEFASHGTVSHSRKEYVRGIIHVNFAESYFSLLKRGIVGTFHHVSERHMQRYLDEFDFRWGNKRATDAERSIVALRGIEGKRLMYRDSQA
jgi:transposase-like protein